MKIDKVESWKNITANKNILRYLISGVKELCLTFDIIFREMREQIVVERGSLIIHR